MCRCGADRASEVRTAPCRTRGGGYRRFEGSAAQLAAVRARRDTRQRAEDAAQVARRAEAGAGRDRRRGQVGAAQQQPRALHPSRPQVAVRRLTRRGPERPREVRAAESPPPPPGPPATGRAGARPPPGRTPGAGPRARAAARRARRRAGSTTCAAGAARSSPTGPRGTARRRAHRSGARRAAPAPATAAAGPRTRTAPRAAGATRPTRPATSASHCGSTYRCSSSVAASQRHVFSRSAGRISDMPGRNRARSASWPRSRSISSAPRRVNEM